MTQRGTSLIPTFNTSQSRYVISLFFEGSLQSHRETLSVTPITSLNLSQQPVSIKIKRITYTSFS